MNRKYRQWAAERFFKRVGMVILFPVFVLFYPVALATYQIARLFHWLRG